MNGVKSNLILGNIPYFFRKIYVFMGYCEHNLKPTFMTAKPSFFKGRAGPLTKKGAALMPVLIIGSGLLTVLISSLHRGVTEKNINHRHHLRHQAKNAAASIVLHGFKKTGGHRQHEKVDIKDGGGVNQDMYNGSGDKNDAPSWLNHLDPDWRSKAAQRWDGNLQNMDHDLPYLNPLGIEEYVPDDPFTPANELRNFAYTVIEPLLPTGHPDRKDDAYRDEKYAFKAGLILRVNENADAPTGFEIKAYKYLRENTNDPKSPPVIDVVTGSPVEIEVALPSGLIGDANSSFTSIGTSGRPELYSEDGSSNVNGGMFDHREDVRQNMVSIDVGMLRKYVDDRHPDNGDPDDLTGDYWSSQYDPTKDWNGVVYVEFPSEANSGGRADKIVRAKSYIDSRDGLKRVLALQTINAEKLPFPTYGADIGLSIATNAPLYMVGNFNADGVAHANDATASEAGEPPASVAADSVTILSNKWDDNRKYSNQNNKINRIANYTEVSAAILTGLKPTIPNDPGTGASSGWISGGAHSVPRFLERWSNKELTIRGSLVALFESEVHEKAMPTNFSHYYSPPKRDWGFHDGFRSGNYPPGSPNPRTFRRIEFRDLTAEEYDYEIENIWTGS